MKNVIMGLFLVTGIATSAMSAETLEKKAQKMVKSMEEGCKVELSTFCKDVTPGEGRRLACLYAYEDRLSGECEYALYDAANKLEGAVMQLTHVANECADDIEKYCSAIAPGEGRIMNCLKKNEKKVTPACTKAVQNASK